MRLALIRALAWLFPLFLFTLAVYICEKEFERLYGGRRLHRPHRHVRGLLGPPSGR